jgi:hypothetical protein
MNYNSWIAAQAEPPEIPGRRPFVRRIPGKKFSTQHLPAHQFPADVVRKESSQAEQSSEAGSELIGSLEELSQVLPPQETFDDPLDRNPELRSYRGKTVSLLRRYMRYSLETGRLPSILGSAFFRSGVTSYRAVTFEDRAIFVRDMEICMERLEEFSRQLIARYVLQGHNHRDTARLLHCNEKTVRRYIPVALDQTSEILLAVGVLERSESKREKSCQGGKNDQFLASDCEDGKYKF